MRPGEGEVRAAHAVLIAVPDTAWAPEATVSRAIPTADAFGRFLERRFASPAIARVTPEAGPVTKAAVLDAFARVAPASGDLFVVLFFGHGLPASEDHPYQAWALTTEELTDLELAARLHLLPPGVDTVVISVCCYGRGFHNAGPRGTMQRAPVPAPPLPLPELSRAYRARLASVVSAPMVCISAAGASADRGAVMSAAAARLVKQVIAAAEQGVSYGDLYDRFRLEHAAGREFHVDARPPERMAHLVLDTQVLPCAGDERGSRGLRRGAR